MIISRLVKSLCGILLDNILSLNTVYAKKIKSKYMQSVSFLFYICHSSKDFIS